MERSSSPNEESVSDREEQPVASNGVVVAVESSGAAASFREMTRSMSSTLLSAGASPSRMVSSIFKRISTTSLPSLIQATEDEQPGTLTSATVPLLSNADLVASSTSSSPNVVFPPQQQQQQQYVLLQQVSQQSTPLQQQQQQLFIVSPQQQQQQQQVFSGDGINSNSTPNSSTITGQLFFNPILPRRASFLALSRSNSVVSVASENERRVYSSLHSNSSKRERWLFYIVAFLAIILRLISVLMTTTESSVWFNMTLKNGQTIPLAKQLIQYGYLPDVLSDFYNAGAWGSLAITFCGSIVIPLLRITLVIACYCIPLEERFHEKRTFVLFVLDHVGRFILVDIFVMGYMSIFSYKNMSILSMIFGSTIKNTSVVEDVTATIALELYATFYAGLLSNIFGTFLTHHLLLMSIPRPPLSDKDAGTKQTLLKRFRLGTRGMFWESEPLFLFTAQIIATMCLVHLLIFQAEIISFQATGFTANLAPSEPARFNIWTILLHFPPAIHVDDPKWLSQIGLYILALVYFTVTISLPIMLILISAWLLLVPMGKALQFELLFASPFWFSWCSVDIFLLMTVSQYYEMGSVAEYMAKVQYPHMCGFVEDKFKTECTGVHCEFGPGIYSLTILCVCLLFIRARFIAMYEMMGEKETSDRLPVIL